MKWEDKATLLGRVILVGEDAEGRSWASVSGAKLAIFVSSKATQPGAVLAIMAAFCYRSDAK